MRFLLSELLSFFCNRNKFESHKKACEYKSVCNINMPSDDTILLEFNKYQKSNKKPFIIYSDLESS